MSISSKATTPEMTAPAAGVKICSRQGPQRRMSTSHESLHKYATRSLPQ